MAVGRAPCAQSLRTRAAECGPARPTTPVHPPQAQNRLRAGRFFFTPPRPLQGQVHLRPHTSTQVASTPAAPPSPTFNQPHPASSPDRQKCECERECEGESVTQKTENAHSLHTLFTAQHPSNAICSLCIPSIHCCVQCGHTSTMKNLLSPDTSLVYEPRRAARGRSACTRLVNSSLRASYLPVSPYEPRIGLRASYTRDGS